MKPLFVSQANTGIIDRYCKAVAIDGGEELGPQTIAGGIDGFLITKRAQVIGLARLKEGDVRTAGTVAIRVLSS